MNALRRLFREETATAEATSTVVMIAAVGVLLAAGLVAWYTGLNTAFNTAGSKVKGLTGSMITTFPSGS
jgi:Flp pilus assembly pilin Flp